MRLPMLFTIVAVAVVCVTLIANAADPQSFLIGQIKVWAIADNTGERDMSVFIAPPEVINQYAPSGKSPSGVLCFLVEHPDGYVLIDTGNGNPPGDARASLLLGGLKRIGITPEAITTIVITHMHGDHIGGLAWEGKAAFPNARVLVGRIEHDFWLSDESVKQFPDRKVNFDKAKQIMALYEGKIEVFEFDAIIVPGLTAVDARGHTPGHTALLLESDGKNCSASAICCILPRCNSPVPILMHVTI